MERLRQRLVVLVASAVLSSAVLASSGSQAAGLCVRGATGACVKPLTPPPPPKKPPVLPACAGTPLHCHHH